MFCEDYHFLGRKIWNLGGRCLAGILLLTLVAHDDAFAQSPASEQPFTARQRQEARRTRPARYRVAGARARREVRGSDRGGRKGLGDRARGAWAGPSRCVRFDGVWKVPDKATQILMARFYDNLWRKKMSKLEALSEAPALDAPRSAEGAGSRTRIGIRRAKDFSVRSNGHSATLLLGGVRAQRRLTIIHARLSLDSARRRKEALSVPTGLR